MPILEKLLIQTNLNILNWAHVKNVFWLRENGHVKTKISHLCTNKQGYVLGAIMHNSVSSVHSTVGQINLFFWAFFVYIW